MNDIDLTLNQGTTMLHLESFSGSVDLGCFLESDYSPELLNEKVEEFYKVLAKELENTITSNIVDNVKSRYEDRLIKEIKAYRKTIAVEKLIETDLSQKLDEIPNSPFNKEEELISIKQSIRETLTHNFETYCNEQTRNSNDVFLAKNLSTRMPEKVESLVREIGFLKSYEEKTILEKEREGVAIDNSFLLSLSPIDVVYYDLIVDYILTLPEFVDLIKMRDELKELYLEILE